MTKMNSFFDYGYHKENSKVLYSTRNLKISNSFKTTFFGQHKMQYESRAFMEQKLSIFFFYLPSTVDINEKINRKPFHVHSADFGEKFNPANPDFDRKSVVS